MCGLPFRTELFRAIRDNNLPLVRSCIDSGVKLHHVDYLHFPITTALVLGHLEIFQLLVDHGADVNKENIHGCTLLSLVIERMETLSLDSIELLLKNGADPNDSTNGPVDQRMHVPLTYAINRDEIEVVKLLIRYKANVNVVTKYGSTPLLYAVANGKYEIVEILLANGADVSISNNIGRCPLMLAKEVAMVELLLAHGADFTVRDRDGDSVMVHAIYHHNIDLVIFWLTLIANALDNEDASTNYSVVDRRITCQNKSIDLNSQNISGHTSFMIAVNEKLLEVVFLLLECNVNVNIKSDLGNSALLCAAKNKSYEIVILLADHAETDLFIVDRYGKGVLAYIDNEEVFNYLLLEMNWRCRKNLLLFLFGCDVLSLPSVTLESQIISEDTSNSPSVPYTTVHRDTASTSLYSDTVSNDKSNTCAALCSEDIYVVNCHVSSQFENNVEVQPRSSRSTNESISYENTLVIKVFSTYSLLRTVSDYLGISEFKAN